MTAPRILVLRALGLGDLLTAVPALRALRRAAPRHEIVLAAPRRLADAVHATGAVDRLLPAEAPAREVPAVLPWTGLAPDLAVDLHGNGPASRDPLAALNPGRLIAYAAPGAPRWRPDDHERLRWCRLLTAHGIPADPDDLLLPAPDTICAVPCATIVHPGADAPARRWPAERFALVARSLHAAGHHVVVTAGRGEADLARQVAASAGLPGHAVLGGEGDIPFPQLAALVARARAVVVGDTGVAHLATACGTPSVVLCGPVSPAIWGPPAGRVHQVLWHPAPDDGVRPGDAHGTRPDPRLLRITPAEVLAAVERLPVHAEHP
ncbi:MULTISPECIES: glycosyltransferase family 9 protein [Streptomycetaceae]|uniref:Transferase n=1 Tax=Streptantibioticus cattleyicolor (strain ATCC 35852 / DSM 46488 / JCM 4925 / NBRC 14057 / NRRL 8057) TaxID=1003195 RepID=F8K2K0_STREN